MYFSLHNDIMITITPITLQNNRGKSYPLKFLKIVLPEEILVNPSPKYSTITLSYTIK